MFNSPRVLVVDDNKSEVKAIKQNLKKFNFSVLEAFDGLEAVELLQKEEVDLVTLDLYMPKMNGAEVLKWLRLNKNTKLSKLPVVVISKQPALQDVGDSVTAIPNTYFLGKSKTEKLIEKIKELSSNE